MDLIHYLDKQAFVWVLSWRHVWLENVFFVITMLGKSYIVVILALLIAGYFWKKNEKKYIVPLFFSCGGATATTYVLKHLISRPRPVDMAVYLEDLSSFPSGHATIAVVFYGFIAYYVFKKIFGWHRWLIVVGGLLLIFLISFSRIYLGVHYLSDVIGGLLVGTLWLSGGIVFLETKKQPATL